MQPRKSTAVRTSAVITAIGQSTQAYHGTWISVGGSKPGGYAGGLDSSVSSMTAMIPARAGPPQAPRAGLPIVRHETRARSSYPQTMKLALFAVLFALSPAPAVESFEEEALVESFRAARPAVRVPSRIVPAPSPAFPVPDPIRRDDDAPTIASSVDVVPRVCSRPPPAR